MFPIACLQNCTQSGAFLTVESMILNFIRNSPVHLPETSFLKDKNLKYLPMSMVGPSGSAKIDLTCGACPNTS